MRISSRCFKRLFTFKFAILKPFNLETSISDKLEAESLENGFSLGPILSLKFSLDLSLKLSLDLSLKLSLDLSLKLSLDLSLKLSLDLSLELFVEFSLVEQEYMNIPPPPSLIKAQSKPLLCFIRNHNGSNRYSGLHRHKGTEAIVEKI